MLFMPIIESGTGELQPVNLAPAAISVVPAWQIHDLGALSIPDSLRFTSGLDVTRLSASNVSMGARGLNNNTVSRMQVLLDGQSVLEDVLGIVYWHQIPVPLAEIKRIEIVKSPASALYGDRAFGGLVNIVTKSPEELRGTFVSQTGGEAGTAITDIIHGGTAGPLAYKLSLGYDRTNQFPNPEVGRASDQFGRADFRARAYVQASPYESASLSFSGAVDQFERREYLSTIPTGSEALGFGVAQIVVDGYLAYVKANYTLGNFRAQLAYNHADIGLSSASLPVPGSAVVDVLKGETRHGFALGATNTLTVGANYRFMSMDSNVLVGGSVTQSVGGFFAQDEWKVRPEVQVTTGVGVDVHPEAGVTVSQRASLVYTPWPDHSFRASFSRAYRNPVPYQNFGQTQLNLVPFPGVQPAIPAVPTLLVLGNKNLDPERMKSYEAGYQGLFLDRVKTRLDFFYAEYANLIGQAQVQIGPTQGVQFTENVGGGDNIGFESGVEASLTSWLTGFANYSFQHRTGKLMSLGGAPNHKANGGLTFYPGYGVTATAVAHVSGPWDIPGVSSYATLDLQLGYRFTMFGADAELVAYAYNLLNDKHREARGGDLIDRRVSGTLRVQF